MMENLKDYLLSEDGQGMVEYALIIAFVAIIAAFVLSGNLRETIGGLFDTANENVQTAQDNAQGN